MRFALLGDHRDGLDLACAFAGSGRHEVRLYSGPSTGLAYLQRQNVTPRSVGDLEELLADPELDAVIVAGSSSVRPAQLRRALQAECHVICVHPADLSPDVAYEAAMIQADTNRVLLPALPATLHPGFHRLAALARSTEPRLVEMEIWSRDDVLLESHHVDLKPCLPGWDVLRFVGGEIGEIYLQSTQAEVVPGEPLLLSGRFVTSRLFLATFVPNQSKAMWRVSLVSTIGRATLCFEDGWPGPAQLTYVDETGASRTESWDALNPWPAFVERFEEALIDQSLRKPQPGQPADDSVTKPAPALGWQDELRALELDDAARRSAEHGRSNTLDLQETTEEATFKGTMTLVGCSLIWLSVIVLILSAWVPWLFWFMLPVFGVFLTLQTLRWILPGHFEATRDATREPAPIDAARDELTAKADAP
ncbi:MAG: Gfo/Idh/MocA family oxidoreductase, partial [Planctomycetes bacterium]|nr:Gfo/Idh/MocA family oxidoreductase [Planctomycetota bacterium]